ncbi:hypothetical protein N9V76_02440 [Candidatus Poseidoniales archaeon]|nr:hypothetical protein [Candidatus Poseidoniales archaeon]
MTRYFVNYIDVDEVQELRKTQHERPIGKYEDGEEIMSYLGTVVQQHVGLASVPTQDVIDDPPVVIGIKKIQSRWHGTVWYMARQLPVSWIKPRAEIDFDVLGCTREYVAGQDEPLGWMSFYAESPCYAIADLKLNDGRKIGDLPEEELQTLFAEVNFENFRFDPQSATSSPEDVDKQEEVVFDDLCICINCEQMMHVDFSSEGYCPECGCGEPEHPGYDDIGGKGAGRDYDFFKEFCGSL